MARNLTEEEKVWRYNYFLRVQVGQIPKRPYDNEYISSMQGNLWPVYQKGSNIIAIKTFNYSTGLIELHWKKIDPVQMSWSEIYGLQQVEINDEIKSIILSTPLPKPPSERALPPAKFMNVKQKDNFLIKCPPFMIGYRLKLIKDDGSWTMTHAAFDAMQKYNRAQERIENEQRKLDIWDNEELLNSVNTIAEKIRCNNVIEDIPFLKVEEFAEKIRIVCGYYQGEETYLLTVDLKDGLQDDVVVSKRSLKKIYDELYKFCVENKLYESEVYRLD